MAYNGQRVVVGAGSIYAAPLGTTEPTAVTGAWPSGWIALGYTDTGSEFQIAPKVSPVEVEEEYWPIRQAITSYEGSMTFALAEATAQNLSLALNSGIPLGNTANTTGTNSDGSVWVEPPIAGAEPRIMLGWDSLPEGTSQPAAANTGFANPFQRLIVRQCLQTGTMKMMHRKGNNKLTYSCVFSLEKPVGVQPVRFIFPAGLSS